MKQILIGILTLSSFALNAQTNTFLDQAFWKTNPDVAKVHSEITKGSDPAELNRMSFDAVVMAINAKAPTESIKFLMEQKGNPVDKLTHDGRTYIFWAARAGNIELMKHLISKGAKLNMEDSHGMTPLAFAAGQPDTQVYDLLIKSGADVKWRNAQGASLLLLAIAGDKDLTLTDYFISKGLSLKDVDAAGNTAFNYATRSGNIDLMKKLVAKGVKYNDNAMVMATQATRGGSGNSVEVFEYLAGLNIKPTAVNNTGETVLHGIARRPNQEAVIKYFLSKGVDVNKADNDGNTAFMNAAASNRDTATLALLASGVKNINQVNKKGVSALAMAVRGNSADVVKFLLGKGADVKVADTDGNNLAWYWIQSSTPQGEGGGRPTGGAPRVDDFAIKMKTLQDAGFDFAAPQKDGNTLYHLAIAKNDLSLLKRLENLKLDVNSKNKEGITALHKAAMVSKDDAVLKYLLEIGAKKDATTEFKETAFDLAKENEFFSKNNVSVDFLK